MSADLAQKRNNIIHNILMVVLEDAIYAFSRKEKNIVYIEKVH